MAIHENDTVKVLEGCFAGKIGKVISIYPIIGVAVVALDSGDVCKVALSSLAEIQEPKKPVEPEIPEGAKQISKADFKAAIMEGMLKVMQISGSSLGAMTGVVIGDSILSAIFKESDVVVITKDQLIRAMWAGCSPEAARKIVNDKMPIGKLWEVSIMAVVTLRNIPEILFGGENG